MIDLLRLTYYVFYIAIILSSLVAVWIYLSIRDKKKYWLKVALFVVCLIGVGGGFAFNHIVNTQMILSQTDKIETVYDAPEQLSQVEKTGKSSYNVTIEGKVYEATSVVSLENMTGDGSATRYVMVSKVVPRKERLKYAIHDGLGSKAYYMLTFYYQ